MQNTLCHLPMSSHWVTPVGYVLVHYLARSESKIAPWLLWLLLLPRGCTLESDTW